MRAGTYELVFHVGDYFGERRFLDRVPIRFTIAAGSLPAGEYDCQVSVLDPAGNRAAFWRTPMVITR